MNMLMAEGSWAVWSWKTKMLHTSSSATLSLLCITNVVTYRTGVEALKHVASLGGFQGHVLAETSVKAEGERKAVSHPLPLLEASSCCLYVQQHLWAVVIWQRHAAHQPWGHKDRKEVVGGRQVGRAREVLSDRYWPWDHQLLSIMDAIGAAVIVWKSAVELSLYVVQLQLCGALWWEK